MGKIHKEEIRSHELSENFESFIVYCDFFICQAKKKEFFMTGNEK